VDGAFGIGWLRQVAQAAAPMARSVPVAEEEDALRSTPMRAAAPLLLLQAGLQLGPQARAWRAAAMLDDGDDRAAAQARLMIDRAKSGSLPVIDRAMLDARARDQPNRQPRARCEPD
jgi:hypothetical protein